MEPWLLTPIANPVQQPERTYNRVHILTRNVVERLNGVLKNRFRCLGHKLLYTPEEVSKIILACCVVHNISRDFMNVEEEFAELPVEPNVIYEGEQARDGFNNRRIVENYFT